MAHGPQAEVAGHRFPSSAVPELRSGRFYLDTLRGSRGPLTRLILGGPQTPSWRTAAPKPPCEGLGGGSPKPGRWGITRGSSPCHKH